MRPHHYDVFAPEWYPKAFDPFITVGEKNDRIDRIIQAGYRFPDGDGSMSSINRNYAVLNNTFDEEVLKDTLHQVYYNNSNKLIANCHDNVHFFKWEGHMSDMKFTPLSNVCEFQLPWNMFIYPGERDIFKMSQFYGRWTKIEDLQNNWKLFKWNIILFVNQRVHSDYDIYINEQFVKIRFYFRQEWRSHNLPVFVYKFDTNFQRGVLITRQLMENQWGWKYPVKNLDQGNWGSFPDQQLILEPEDAVQEEQSKPNIQKVMVTFNRIYDGTIRTDRRTFEQIAVLGDNIEFCDWHIDEGYIDMSNISDWNKTYIRGERNQYMWMSICIPKFLHEWPGLLPVDSVYRPDPYHEDDDDANLIRSLTIRFTFTPVLYPDEERYVITSPEPVYIWTGCWHSTPAVCISPGMFINVSDNIIGIKVRANEGFAFSLRTQLFFVNKPSEVYEYRSHDYTRNRRTMIVYFKLLKPELIPDTTTQTSMRDYSIRDIIRHSDIDLVLGEDCEEGWISMIRPMILSEAYKDAPEPHDILFEMIDDIKTKRMIFIDALNAFSNARGDRRAAVRMVAVEGWELYRAQATLRDHREIPRIRNLELAYHHLLEQILIIFNGGDIPEMPRTAEAFVDQIDLLLNRYIVASTVVDIEQRYLWSDPQEWKDMIRFQRPVEVSDFWFFEYDPYMKVWRPTPTVVDRHFPELYMSKPRDYDLELDKVYKAFFFYTDTINPRELANDPIESTHVWNEDVQQYLPVDGNFRELISEKFFDLALKTVYPGLTIAGTRWEIVQYIYENRFFKHFFDVLLKGSEDFFKYGLNNMLLSDQFGFPFDYRVAKFSESLIQGIHGHRKLDDYELYLKNQWQPAYFDYMEKVTNYHDFTAHLIHRPPFTFDIRKIRRHLTIAQTQLSEMESMYFSYLRESLVQNDALAKEMLENMDGSVHTMSTIMRSIKLLDPCIYSVDEVNVINELIRVLTMHLEKMATLGVEIRDDRWTSAMADGIKDSVDHLERIIDYVSRINVPFIPETEWANYATVYQVGDISVTDPGFGYSMNDRVIIPEVGVYQVSEIGEHGQALSIVPFGFTAARMFRNPTQNHPYTTMSDGEGMGLEVTVSSSMICTIERHATWGIDQITTAVPGSSYAVGDIVQLNGDARWLTDEPLETSIGAPERQIYLQVMSVDDKTGGVVTLKPLIDYAINWFLWGIRSTETIIGDGEGLRVDSFSYLMTDTSGLLLHPYQFVPAPPAFRENDLFQFKFQNIYDLDIQYEIFLGGLQWMDFKRRHIDTEDVLHPGKIDVLYVRANLVNNLMNSSIFVSDDPIDMNRPVVELVPSALSVTPNEFKHSGVGSLRVEMVGVRGDVEPVEYRALLTPRDGPNGSAITFVPRRRPVSFNRVRVNTARMLRIRKLFPYEQRDFFEVGRHNLFHKPHVKEIVPDPKAMTHPGGDVEFDIRLRLSMDCRLMEDLEVSQYMHFRNQLHLQDVILFNKTTRRFENILDPRRFHVHFRDDKRNDEGYEFKTAVKDITIVRAGEEYHDGLVWGYNLTHGLRIFGHVTSNEKGNMTKFINHYVPNMVDCGEFEFHLFQHPLQSLGNTGIISVEFETNHEELADDGYIRDVTNPMAILAEEYKIVPKVDFIEAMEYEVLLSKTSKTWLFVEPEWIPSPTFSVKGYQVPASRIYIKINGRRFPLVNPATRHPSFRVKHTEDGFDITFNNLYRRFEQFEVCTLPYPIRSVYTQRRIPMDGYIDLTGKLNKPLNKKHYEFWVNGRLLHDEVTIVTPSKIILHGLTSLKNLEIIEINRDPHEFFSDEFMHTDRTSYTQPRPAWDFYTFMCGVTEANLPEENFTLFEQEELVTPAWKQVDREHPNYIDYPENNDTERDILLRYHEEDLPLPCVCQGGPHYQYRYIIIDPPQINGISVLGINQPWSRFGLRRIPDKKLNKILENAWGAVLPDCVCGKHVSDGSCCC